MQCILLHITTTNLQFIRLKIGMFWYCRSRNVQYQNIKILSESSSNLINSVFFCILAIFFMEKKKIFHKPLYLIPISGPRNVDWLLAILVPNMCQSSSSSCLYGYK